MAIHLSTPPFSGGERPRLPSAQVGPVTQAIRAMRAADPADRAIADLQDGLDQFFAEADYQPIPAMRAPTWHLHAVRQLGDEQLRGIRALSRNEVENLVEGLIDLLDAYDRDADHEPDLDRELDEQDGCASEWAGRGAHRFNVGRAA